MEITSHQIVDGRQKVYRHLIDVRNMKSKNKTTFFTNEITGSTHYDKKTDWVAVAIVAVMVLAALLIIGEQTGLTSWLLGTV